MDALSKILNDIQLKNSEYIHLKTQGEWVFTSPEQAALVGYIVLAGQAYFEVNSTQSVTAKAGDIVLMLSGTAHFASNQKIQKLLNPSDISTFFNGHSTEIIELGTPSDQQSLILSLRCKIDSIMARPLMNAMPTIMHMEHNSTSTAPEWLQIGLYFLALETQTIRAGRDVVIDHLVNILLIQCIRDHIEKLSDADNWLNAFSYPELSSALAAIHGQPEQAWTVESLAEQCCMSRSKFASLFHEVIGESPLAYLQQHRLRLASQYLRNSNLSVQQIATKVGYSSETAFSQAFKRVYTQSPREYRQHNQAKV